MTTAQTVACRPACTYSVTTRGGILFVGHPFKINYLPRTSAATIWKTQEGFSLTIFSSASGTGKTSFLQHLYCRLLRRGYFALPVDPSPVEALIHGAGKVFGKHKVPGTPPTILTFDFSPNLEPHVSTSTGYVPQHAPKVQHWLVSALLPEASAFLSCFFPDQTPDELVHKRIGEFSGGQRSKIYACSALEKLKADSPPCAFLLLDETFDGLGAEEAGRCLNKIKQTWSSEVSVPLHVLLVTHLSEKELLADSTIQCETLALAVSSNTESELTVEVFNR